ncbi:hypothetical protein LWI29_024625 [Acer saccharum]|uniref:Protein FAR1-RELATED SEQUENCE n=1 Tax=Acer saccharum TaxID=4024 RepID=A0AA39RR26_ACESA|nr:hypothetical protein LWI29_024625 [Acer saccharum]
MDCVMYTFQKFAGGDKTWNVKYTPSTNVFKCSCQMFETICIPCCNTFSVMKVMNQHHIPETLIMQRWTRNAKDISEVESSSTATTPNITQIARYGALSSKCSRMSYYASLSTEGYNEANVAIDKLTIQMKGLLPSSSTTMEENVYRTRTQSRVPVKDPVIAATKRSMRQNKNTKGKAHLVQSCDSEYIMDSDGRCQPFAFQNTEVPMEERKGSNERRKGSNEKEMKASNRSNGGLNERRKGSNEKEMKASNQMRGGRVRMRAGRVRMRAMVRMREEEGFE